MIGKIGDRIVVDSAQVGQAAREGEILEVTDTPSGPHYRIRWDDGHESVLMPKVGGARIVPGRRKRSA
jgi:hypothetical protein